MLNAKQRKDYIKIARDFLYPSMVVDALLFCQSEIECERILADARKGRLDLIANYISKKEKERNGKKPSANSYV